MYLEYIYSLLREYVYIMMQHFEKLIVIPDEEEPMKLATLKMQQYGISKQCLDL